MIDVNGLYKRYRRRDVLSGVSFTSAKGQITCLIGINGAGKSTILKAIMGLTPLKNGTVLIDGEPIGKNMYEKVAFIPDRLTMPTGMRVADGLRFMQDFYRSWNPARAEELISFFRLDPSERIGSLSKGTAAKLNLVLGLAQDTDYVLMDEPFSGIDLFSKEQIAEVFTSHLIEDRGVLLTTHEIGDVEHLIDRAVLLHDGKVGLSFDCEQMRSEQGKSVIDVMREVYRT
ncbi:ATP-binding cassette domain-containing protein [Paenibacillus beijingensis]|uniref:Multidrug ABC transporter ATP-binding protein n=1 Tax=Paenibacillus beijingensis TaxID=1126833 RepID=A0A0D5NJL3_9BACL|nr:ABC transporter ATP-binding protein [Paenibacillus beijingensis]AJY75461.1 multidrug ABC transporter ATP-binding protein [Paenibacillus beijingensis]